MNFTVFYYRYIAPIIFAIAFLTVLVTISIVIICFKSYGDTTTNEENIKQNGEISDEEKAASTSLVEEVAHVHSGDPAGPWINPNPETREPEPEDIFFECEDTVDGPRRNYADFLADGKHDAAMDLCVTCRDAVLIRNPSSTRLTRITKGLERYLDTTFLYSRKKVIYSRFFSHIV